MKGILKVILASLILLANVSAQNNLKFDFDFAKFSYDTTSVFLEFYYAFEKSGLTVVEVDGQQKAQFTLSMVITNSETGQVVLDREWNGGAEISQQENMNRKNLVGTLSMVLPFGKYELKIKGLDRNDKSNLKEYTESLDASQYGGANACLSDIQLASSIRRQGVDPNSLFYKNGMEITPNPTSMYGEDSPVLYYYVEVYPKTGLENSENCTLNLVLHSGSQRVVYEKTKKLALGSNAIFDVGLINLQKYATGSYSFTIELENTDTKEKTFTTKKVFLYNPTVVDSTVIPIAVNNSFLTSQFSTFSIEECDNHYDIIQYIMSENQKDKFEDINNLDTKREFLFEFWKNLDPKPETAQNEYHIDFMARLKYVNRDLKTKYKKGYKTDRGRVFLKYGKPDQIDRHPFDSDTKPYEIWYYDSIEGGVLFIFADLTGYSNYILLHSTKRGEPQDPTWNQKIIQVY